MDDELVKLNPEDFKVIEAWTPDYADYQACLVVEVAPGYLCLLRVEHDDEGPWALPATCSDGEGYIFMDDNSWRESTAMLVSDEDILAVERFATDYYINHYTNLDDLERYVGKPLWINITVSISGLTKDVWMLILDRRDTAYSVLAIPESLVDFDNYDYSYRLDYFPNDISYIIDAEDIFLHEPISSVSTKTLFANHPELLEEVCSYMT